MNERGFTELMYFVRIDNHDFTFFRSDEAMDFARTILIAGGDDLKTINIEVRKFERVYHEPDEEADDE